MRPTQNPLFAVRNSDDIMRNAIGLAYSYEDKLIFYPVVRIHNILGLSSALPTFVLIISLSVCAGEDRASPMGIIAIIDTQTAYTTNTSSLQQRKETCKDTSSGVAECSCLSNRTLLADGKKCSSSQLDRVPVPPVCRCDGIPHSLDGSDESEKYCSGHFTVLTKVQF